MGATRHEQFVRRYVEQNFSIGEMVSKYVTLYEESARKRTAQQVA